MGVETLVPTPTPTAPTSTPPTSTCACSAANVCDACNARRSGSESSATSLPLDNNELERVATDTPTKPPNKLDDVGQDSDDAVAVAVDQLLQDDRADPDQELSPTPPTKAAESYDLWGAWSVRSFREDRASLTSPPASDWRAFRSLSIDEKEAPTSPLSNNNNNDALRSLSFTSPPAEDANPRPTAATKRTPRPRSFSDYTSLGAVKLHDIWNERSLPPLDASLPPLTLSPGDELCQSMQTTVASRHVIVKSVTGAFTPSSLRRVLKTLGTYGPIASIREEFTSDGVLFCTFFQLKAAIGAVKLWFTNAKSRDTTAVFSVPYEAPNDINSATLLVQIHGPAVLGAFSDMRQLCSRYGEVASVLEREGDDATATPFLVEFNDSRDITTALSSLNGALLPSGHVISAARSHPPTFDLAKVQAFQESVDAASMPSFVNRPKSFSEGTSILTSPSSTSSSSPLHGSFFETRSSSFRQMSDLDSDLTLERTESFNETSTPSARSPPPSITPSLASAGTAWRVRESARPRSSSAFASLSGDTSSGLLADAFSPPPARPSRYAHAQSSQYRPLPTAPGFPQQLNAHTLMMQGRMGPMRSGSDPGFRNSYAASTTSSTTSSIGRNDQGTGEYSLSIEKVAAGEDKRTTLMVRNIPNKYTQQMLLAEINEHHHGQYDFFYLPIDFKNKCNMGYAFINFIEAESIVSFYQEFDSQKWTNFNSEKVCAISYARLQGKQAMITRFQNSSLLEKHESYRPLVFYSSGPNQGRPEPFPSPKPQHQHHPHAHVPFANKKPYHQHHVSQGHPQMLLSASDEYRLYAHQQQQQLHAAQVLHGHALLANAHAAAAAMLHTMPGLGMQAPSYHTPARAVHYGHAYQQPDRRQGQSYVNGVPSRTPAYSAFGSFSGASYSSSSTQS